MLIETHRHWVIPVKTLQALVPESGELGAIYNRPLHTLALGIQIVLACTESALCSTLENLYFQAVLLYLDAGFGFVPVVESLRTLRALVLVHEVILAVGDGKALSG